MYQWRHIKGIKRGAGAHQSHPLSETAPGSHAIKCLACPHPGWNLPDNWDSVCGANEWDISFYGSQILLTYSRWIYVQFIAVDANFRLKSKNRQIKDPELGSGWSYFVENTTYTHHVAKPSHEKEVRMCTPASGRGFDSVPRLQAVALNSMQSIKRTHMVARTTLPAVSLRQSAHNTALYCLTLWVICNMVNSMQNCQMHETLLTTL